MLATTRKLLGWLLPALILLASGPARSGEDAPEALVQRVTEEVLEILRTNGNAGDEAERRRAVELIESKIAPHFDFRRMTALAVGRGWRDADPAQREALTEAFRALLVRTYSNALANYENQTVRFRPAQKSPEADQAMVRSQIVQPGATPIALDYRLAKTDQGWKVFDIAVDHVSLVTSYRSSFTSEINKGGIAGLLDALQAKVGNLDGQPRSNGAKSAPTGASAQR